MTRKIYPLVLIRVLSFEPISNAGLIHKKALIDGALRGVGVDELRLTL